jgi:hypothetical protein
MNVRKSKKSEKELRNEHAEQQMAENPYEKVRLDDEYLEEKLKVRPKHKGRWERIRAKLG